MFACGGVQDPFKVFKTAPRSELPCSPRLELAESDIGNTVLVVELAEDGLDPVTWSTTPTVQVCHSACLIILHLSYLAFCIQDFVFL